MKKLVLICAMLISMSFVGLSAFDYIAEWQAIIALFDKQQAACFANKGSVFNKRMLLEIVVTILKNYSKDGKKESLKPILSTIQRRELVKLAISLISELKPIKYDRNRIISIMREKIIGTHYEFDRELIITQSLFGQEGYARVTDFKKSNLEKNGDILNHMKEENKNKVFIYVSDIPSSKQIADQHARMDLYSFEAKYKKLTPLPKLMLPPAFSIHLKTNK